VNQGMPRATLFVAAILVTSCQGRPERPAPAQSLSGTVDVWTRSSQCASLAERLHDRHVPNPNDRRIGPRPIRFQSHYNRRLQRCFVLLEWETPDELIPAMPPFYKTVYDAVENTDLATFNNDPAQSVHCNMLNEDGKRASPGCEKVMAYVQSLMKE
jgi:hypothetical protein